MGTTLTGTTPQDTYDSLIKVTDNGPLSSTAKYLSDGLGNDSALALSTATAGIGITNTNSVKLAITGNSGLPATSGTTQTGLLRLKASNNATLDIGADHVNAVGWLQVTDVADLSQEYNLILQPNGGNVGIGTSSPNNKLEIVGGNGNQLLLNNAGEQFTQMSFQNNGGQKAAIWLDETVDEFVIYAAAGYTTPIYANGNERVRVTNDGLTFNGDTAAANALDDYEEGTFTATLVPSTSGSITLFSGFQTLSYTKIGRQVTVKGLLLVESVSSPVGTEVKIQGLPFVIANAGSARGSGSVFVAGNSFNSSVYHGQNVSEISVIYDASTVSSAANSDWYVTFTYFV